MRQKRLAKLQNSSSQGRPNIQPAPVVKQPTPPVPLVPSVQPVQEKRAPAPSKPAQNPQEVAAKEFAQLSEEKWQDAALKETLQVTLEVRTLTQESVTGLVYLPELVSQLVQENLPLVLNQGVLERALYARITLLTPVPLFDYLLGVWKRAKNLQARIQGFQTWVNVGPRIPLLEEIQTLAVSYAGLVLNPEMEGMFPQSHR